MADSFQFVLYPYNDYLPFARDEFLVGQLRVVLEGNTLKLASELGNPVHESEARELANRYAKLLGKYLGVLLSAITHDELGQMLPSDTNLTRFGQSGQRSLSRAIRASREGLLTSGDVTLRRAYNYLQDARDRPEAIFSSLYKCVELFEKRWGEPADLFRELRVKGKDVDFVKTLANKGVADLRHAPGPTEPIVRLTDADKTKGTECVTRIVHAYEHWLNRDSP